MSIARMFLILSVIMMSLSSIHAAQPSSGLRAFVSILPQKDIVERLGKELVEVEVLVGPGQSPGTYEPTPRQMASIAGADLYFCIGVPFEKVFVKRLPKIAKGLEIIDTGANIQHMYLDHVDKPNPKQDHNHGRGVHDPHIWLDPKRVMIQAETICRALSRNDPSHSAEYKENLDVFIRDLARLDNEIMDMLTPFKGDKIYVFHPAFGYFAHSYGLIQVPVEIEGKEPSAMQLTRLIERAKAEGIGVIFVQPQFSGKNAAAIAQAINGSVVQIDPLPSEYIAGMRRMASIIADCLQKKKSDR